MTSSIIRRAVAGDAPAIERLYRELVSDPLIRVLPERVGALSVSPTGFLLVAEVDGEVCATALLTLCQDVMYGDQPFGVLENIVVARTRRGHGVGRLLMRHIEQWAGTHHCTKLMLLSGSARVEAHAFFRNCGFSGDTKHAFVKYRRHFTLE